MENRADIISHLFSLNARGIKLGLENITGALRRIGDPHTSFRAIHVAGTNGKGSVCAYLESILRTAGYKTGLFTSPHIINFEERFAINGVPIQPDNWIDIYAELKPVINEFSLTFFEAATLIGFELFKREHIDWLIAETGLGGRLDATNVLVPRVSVITSIDIDHTEYLGTDLVSIAREKLGIVKRGMPLVMPLPSQKEIESLVVATCNENRSPLSFVWPQEIIRGVSTWEGSDFVYRNVQYHTPLIGEIQINNAVTALKCIEQLPCLKGNPAIADGIAHTKIAGRFQKISFGEQEIVFDCGHNPGAFSQFVANCSKYLANKVICVIVGIMKDKDYPSMMNKLLGLSCDLICTQPGINRAAIAQKLFDAIPVADQQRCTVIPSVSQAMRTAIERRYQVICVTGSFHTVGEAIEELRIGPL